MKSMQNALCLFIIMLSVGISKGKTISADNVSSKFFLFHDTQWNYRVKEHLAQDPKRINKLLSLTEGI